MATIPQRKIGTIDCLCCGEAMPVRQNGRDTLNVSCPWCGFSAYAKGGSDANRIISGFMRKDSPVETPVDTQKIATATDQSIKIEPIKNKKTPLAAMAKTFSFGDL